MNSRMRWIHIWIRWISSLVFSTPERLLFSGVTHVAMGARHTHLEGNDFAKIFGNTRGRSARGVRNILDGLTSCGQSIFKHPLIVHVSLDMFDIIVFVCAFRTVFHKYQIKCTIFKHVNNTHGRFQVEAFDAIEAGCVEKIGWQNSVSLWHCQLFQWQCFYKGLY